MNSPLDPALELLAEVLRHSFAQAQDELEIDTSALVQKLEEEEPDKFVANNVNTPWNEYFRAVLDRDRSDLTVESTILKLAEEYPYWKHLLSAQLDRANRWLVLGERLRGAQRSLESSHPAREEFPIIVGGDWICRAQGKAYAVRDVYCCTLNMDQRNQSCEDQDWQAWEAWEEQAGNPAEWCFPVEGVEEADRQLPQVRFLDYSLLPISAQSSYLL